MEHLVEIANQTEFPWLMGNVRDRQTGRLLAEGQESHVLDWDGRKVCVLYIHTVKFDVQVEIERV